MSPLITKESSNFVLRVMHLDSTHAVIDAILLPTGANELCRKIAEKQDNLKDLKNKLSTALASCPGSLQQMRAVSAGRGGNPGKRRATTTTIPTVTNVSTSSLSTRISGGRGAEIRPAPRIQAPVSKPSGAASQFAIDSASYGQLQDKISGLFAVRASKPSAAPHEGSEEDLHQSMYKVSQTYLKGTFP